MKSLGLGNGKALFRLLQRNPEQLKEQAHVYNIPSKPKVPKTEESADSRTKRVPIVDSKSKVSDPLSVLKSEKPKRETSCEREKQKECHSKTEETEQIALNDNSNKAVQKKNETPMEVDGNVESCSATSEEIAEEPKVEYVHKLVTNYLIESKTMSLLN